MTDHAKCLLLDAENRALTRGLVGEVTDAILLRAILRFEKTFAVLILEHANVDLSALDASVELVWNKAPTASAKANYPSYKQLGNIVDSANRIALEYSDEYVGSEHLLAALVEGGSETVQRLMQPTGLSAELVFRHRTELFQLLKDSAADCSGNGSICC